jgi:hypothetical protein
MSDEEALAFYKELQDHYGESLANFEHYPRIFQNQVLMYNYYKSKQNENSSVQ